MEEGLGRGEELATCKEWKLCCRGQSDGAQWAKASRYTEGLRRRLRRLTAAVATVVAFLAMLCVTCAGWLWRIVLVRVPHLQGGGAGCVWGGGEGGRVDVMGRATDAGRRQPCGWA